MWRSDDEPTPKRLLPTPRRFQWRNSELLLRVNVFKDEPTAEQMQQMEMSFSGFTKPLSESLRQVPHLVGSSVILPSSPEFGVYYGVHQYAAMFKFPSTLQTDLCGFELILVPSVIKLNDAWIHFLLPVADINGVDFGLMFPPIANNEDLVMTADEYDASLFATLALRYTTRIPLLDEKVIRKGMKLAWKPKCKFDLNEMVYAQVVFDEVADGQTAFVCKLLNLTQDKQAVRSLIVAGTETIKGMTFLQSSQKDLFPPHPPPPQLTAENTDLVVLRKKLQKSVRLIDNLQTKLKENEEALVRQKEQILKMDAAKEQVQAHLDETLASLKSVQAVLEIKKEHFEAVLLKEVRSKHKDVGYYINFTLKHMFIDLDEEVVNWQDRYDALIRIRDESVSWLKLEMQHRYNIVMTEDPLPEFKTVVEQQVQNDTMKITADWDIGRFRQEYTDLRAHLFIKETDESMYKDLYQFALRAKEERFALQLQAARDQSKAACGTSLIHKAWNGLTGAFRLMSEAAERVSERPKLLGLGSLFLHFMHSALEFSKNEALQASDIAEALLLGCGRDRIELVALKTQDNVQFDSPMRELMITLSETMFDPRMTFVAPNSNGVTLLDQALLAVAGQPMVDNLDETLFFMKNNLGFASDFRFQS